MRERRRAISGCTVVWEGLGEWNVLRIATTLAPWDSIVLTIKAIPVFLKKKLTHPGFDF
jgi:hypothetical protein